MNTHYGASVHKGLFVIEVYPNETLRAEKISAEIVPRAVKYYSIISAS